MAAKKDSSIAAPVVSDKKKALETAMQQIEKTYGKGSIMRYGDNVQPNVEAIPTGSLALDLALGIGGVPRGRIIEIYGPESSGKTTLALHVLAQAQKMGGEVAFVDAEHALDPTYARALGVKIEDMLISQPDNGEQALEICEALVRSGAIDVVVVDSVAALVPRAEIEGEMGDSFVGLHARLMSQALRKLTGIIAKTNTVVIFINQLREKVGVMYGNPEVTTGGRALKFYASVRIDVRRVETLKAGGEVVGNHVRAKVVNFQGLSSHADHDHLVNWISQFKEPKPQHVFVVHGDREVAPVFAQTVTQLGFAAHAPQYTESYDLLTCRQLEAGYLPERKKPAFEGAPRTTAAYQRLVQLGDALLGLIRRSKGRDNKTLASFAESLRKLIEKFEF